MSSSFFDLVAQRYSVRTFSQEPVEKDKILQILEAARLAQCRELSALAVHRGH